MYHPNLSGGSGQEDNQDDELQSTINIRRCAFPKCHGVVPALCPYPFCQECCDVHFDEVTRFLCFRDAVHDGTISEWRGLKHGPMMHGATLNERTRPIPWLQTFQSAIWYRCLARRWQPWTWPRWRGGQAA
jgi:hypothetical protein